MKRFPYSKVSRGQSLIEILLDMGLAVLAISGIAYALIGPQVSVRHSAEAMQAEALAKEGLVAVRSIAAVSFDGFAPGSYGIARVGDEWSLTEAPDVTDQFERTISMATVDEDLYAMTSTVVWSIGGGREKSVSTTSYLSNWRQTKGQAAFMSFDTDALGYNASGTRLVGARVENTHATSAVTLTDLTLSWDGGGAVQSITIDEMAVYSAGSSTLAISGTQIDIADVSLTAGAPSVSFGPLEFTVDMQSNPVQVISHLSDGSLRYTHLIP